jgi:hypothetical protein
VVKSVGVTLGDVNPVIVILLESKLKLPLIFKFPPFTTQFPTQFKHPTELMIKEGANFIKTQPVIEFVGVNIIVKF